MCTTTESGREGSKASLVMKGDFGQILVKVMGTHLISDPFQNEVGGRNNGYFPGIGVEGVFTRQKRFAPHRRACLFPPVHRGGIRPGKIRAGLAGIGDDHADVTDLDGCFGDHLNRTEQAVDVIGTFHQHLQLAATQTHRLAGSDLHPGTYYGKSQVPGDYHRLPAQ